MIFIIVTFPEHPDLDHEITSYWPDWESNSKPPISYIRALTATPRRSLNIYIKYPIYLINIVKIILIVYI